MKAVVVQFIYETNTFCPKRAGIEVFRDAGTWRVGEAEAREWTARANSQMAASVRTLEAAGWEAHPVFVAFCGSPSGRITRECYATIRETMKGEIRGALPADALLMHLHGAAAAEGVDDAEGDLLEMARKGLGFGGRLVLSLDLHANMTRRMMHFADAITAYRTMPHMDLRETGERAARLAMAKGPFSRAVAKIAALVPPSDQSHFGGRFADLLAEARAAERSDGVEDVVLLPVQPWLDVAELGSAVVVTGRGKRLSQTARRLAETWYAQRRDWQTGLLDWDAILGKVKTRTKGPWILVDTGDATSGGSEGRSAEALRRLLPHQDSFQAPVLLCVVDPEAVAATKRGEKRFRVGDPAVELEAEVLWQGEGRYTTRGGLYPKTTFSMCGAAVLKCGAIHVVIGCQPTMVIDPAFYECAGLRPDDALAVQTKSIQSWRAAFVDSPPEAGLFFDGPGQTPLRFEKLPFKGDGRGVFPVQSDPKEPIRLWNSN